MSRRSKSKRLLAQPDPIYNSRLVTLLVARILKSGKKSIAQKIVYKALKGRMGEELHALALKTKPLL